MDNLNFTTLNSNFYNVTNNSNEPSNNLIINATINKRNNLKNPNDYLTKNTNNNNNNNKPETQAENLILEKNQELNKEIMLLNNEIEGLKIKIRELNLIIEQIRNENFALNNLNNTKKSLENPYFIKADTEAKSALYESLIIFLKNIQLSHILEIYKMNMEREEEIRKILETKKIPNFDEIKKQYGKLNENFIVYKTNCENALQEYYKRANAYINIEDYKNKIMENKNFTENILNTLLVKFFEKKETTKDFIFFKFDHNEYNQILEDLTIELQNFHKNELNFLEILSNNFNNIQPAIDLLEKQSVLESDKLNNIFNNPDYKLI
jgi:hypothetical protein